MEATEPAGGGTAEGSRPAAENRVVATAGHVDHGKSALIIRLTGIEPDRWAEEKRRGLTIDLGYAWCMLPSGREIGFVDVPGHERFVRNMLAGVGPVRVVLFVVAADEGWKPQSEEHLQIVDVLGVAGGVVALTKRDLVDDETLQIAEDEIRERVAGTALEAAPIVPVSSVTGDGIEQLREALDAVLAAAPAPEPASTRLFVDRAFTIRGAGTVVTGTLTGGCLEVGDEIELSPSGRRARIRSLQSHERPIERACPVARVAANLVGVDRGDVGRGDVMGRPGEWRATSVVDAVVRPVRGLGHPLTSRGAYKVHAGAAEVDARLRLFGEGYVRLRLDPGLALDVGDRFVLREAGRRETVGGGIVLDVAPPARAGPDPISRLSARASARRDELPGLLVAERKAVRAADARRLTGSDATGGIAVGEWLVHPELREAVEDEVVATLATFHDEHPLDEGAPLDDVRAVTRAALRGAGAPSDAGLVDGILDDLVDRGSAVRGAASFRLAAHRVALEERQGDVDRLVTAISGEHEATPPDVKALLGAGFGRDVIDAAGRAGHVVRIAPELVVSPAFVERAVALVRAHASTGITVSALREALGTSRKYAVPLLEHLDRTGVTRREGDLRYPRTSGRRAPHATSTVAATSTLAPSGSEATPTAALACSPCSPSTSANSSLAPFATVGWSWNSGVAATKTDSCTTCRTSSNEPRPPRSAASSWTPARRAASAPCATETSSPSLPGCSTFPSTSGTWPARNTRWSARRNGRYAATALGMGGSSIPSSDSFWSTASSFMPASSHAPAG